VLEGHIGRNKTGELADGEDLKEEVEGGGGYTPGGRGRLVGAGGGT
jgi:hypothetical protein